MGLILKEWKKNVVNEVILVQIHDILFQQMTRENGKGSWLVIFSKKMLVKERKVRLESYY